MSVQDSKKGTIKRMYKKTKLRCLTYKVVNIARPWNAPLLILVSLLSARFLKVEHKDKSLVTLRTYFFQTLSSWF